MYTKFNKGYLIFEFLILFGAVTTGTVKFHKIGHYSDNIREWGCPSNTNAETWETAHKWFVKRWMGRMQHNRTGAMNTVMRRNLVAEGHRGSIDLLTAKPKRARDHFTVLNAVQSQLGSYRQFYDSRCDLWIHCGDAITYSANQIDGPATIARVEAIRVSATGVFSLDLWVYSQLDRPPDEQRPLDRYTTRWALIPGHGLSVSISPIEEDIEISPYPMQPDFSDLGNHYFSCPWMRIVR